MSDAPNVETEQVKTEAAEDEAAAIWADLEKQEAGLADEPPAEADKDKPDEAERPQAEAPAEQQPAPQATDELWKAAPPELREAHERALAAERTRAEQAETIAKRHSGRLSQRDHQLAQMSARIAELEKPVAGETDKQAEDRKALRERLKDEYGDSAGILVPDVEAVEQRVAELEGRLSAQSTERTEAQLLEQQSILDAAHPDWSEVVRTQAYLDWKGKQSGYIQRTIEENANAIIDGASCADILDRYKRDMAPPKTPEQQRHDERREEQREALRDPSLRGPQVTGQDSEDPAVIWSELQAKDHREAAGAR